MKIERRGSESRWAITESTERSTQVAAVDDHFPRRCEEKERVG